MTAAEESACVGHELGHCLYGGFYTRTTPFDTVERHEARADKWYILNAIPCGTLFSLLRRGYDAWEIAEQLGTTEEYVRRAYYIYMDTGAPTPRCDCHQAGQRVYFIVVLLVTGINPAKKRVDKCGKSVYNPLIPTSNVGNSERGLMAVNVRMTWRNHRNGHAGRMCPAAE